MALTRLYNNTLINPLNLSAIYETFENVELATDGDNFRIYRIYSKQHNIPNDDNIELLLFFHQKLNNKIFIEFQLKPIQ